FVDFMAPRSVLAYLSSESVGSPRHGGMVYQASKAATEEAVRVLATEHPELRFTTIAVGATVGTEIGADRDPTIQARFATEWLRRGTIKRAFMEASQLGELIMAMLTPVVLYDAADVREIRIEPAGPIAPDLAAITTAARLPASESRRRVEGAS